ncbi:MAG TPA: tetratricopeptide repeat protein [Anaerolineae bacterium]|nr:tetratricopeptide repeat protein [Anaerolineae bacterium]
MNAATVPASQDWHRFFCQTIVVNCHYWLKRTQADLTSVLQELPQVLTGLSFALSLPEAWSASRDLIAHLSPLIIRQGASATWETYLTRSIARSAQEKDPAEIYLRLQLGELYRLQGRFPEARDCLQTALALCEPSQNRSHYWSLLNRLGLVARQSAQHEAALSYSSQVLAEPDLPLAEQAEACNVLGLVAHDRREWSEALRYFDQALRCYRSVGDGYQVARMLNNRGLILLRSDRLAEAEESYRAAITQFQAVDDPIEQFKSAMNLGNVFLMRQDYEAAIRQYLTALPIFRRFSYVVDQAHTHNNLGMAYGGLGRWEPAEAHYTTSIDLWRSVGDRYNLANALDNLGLMVSQAGQPERAREILEEALDVLRPGLDNPANVPLFQAITHSLAQVTGEM